MSENISTMQEVINVELRNEEENDFLIFLLGDEGEEELKINLNAEDGRKELAIMFSALLKRMLKNSIVLSLSIQEGYEKGLYKDVAKEYIDALNAEIQKVYENIKEELL